MDPHDLSNIVTVHAPPAQQKKTRDHRYERTDDPGSNIVSREIFDSIGFTLFAIRKMIGKTSGRNSSQDLCMVIIAVFLTITEVKKSGKPVVFRTFGGDKRDRTADLLNAIRSGAKKSHRIGR